MVTNRALIAIQTLLLLSQGALGQVPTNNATLYIPGINVVHIGTDEALIASSVTTKDSSTIYQVLDVKPTETGTLTVLISPSGANLLGSDSSLGVEGLNIVNINTTCSFSGNRSNCNLEADLSSNGKTETFTSRFSEFTGGVHVVGVNFGATTTAPPTPSPTGASNTTAKTNSAVKGQVSLGSVALIACGLLFKLL